MALVIGIRSAPATEMNAGARYRRDAATRRFVVVALRAAGTMDDDLRSIHCGLDSLASREVTSNEFDALHALAAAPAEDPYVTSGVLQPGNDQPSEPCHLSPELSYLFLLVTLFLGCHLP